MLIMTRGHTAEHAIDLQARRLESRMRSPKVPGVEPRKDYVHMLNCTLSATQRTLCCVLENFQTPDGVRYALAPQMHSHQKAKKGTLYICLKQIH